jgi:hypothetical protein
MPTTRRLRTRRKRRQISNDALILFLQLKEAGPWSPHWDQIVDLLRCEFEPLKPWDLVPFLRPPPGLYPDYPDDGCDNLPAYSRAEERWRELEQALAERSAAK